MTGGPTRAGDAFLGPPRAASFAAFGRRVDTWVARIIGPGSDAGALSARELTSEEEVARADRIVHPAPRRRFLAGRALARWALAPRLGCPPQKVPIGIGRNGRPVLAIRGGAGARPEATDFNLSHSGDQVVLVVACGLGVGIDVERLADRENSRPLARRIFSAREQRLLAASDRSAYLEQWYRIWTTREAYVKVTGSGLSSIAADMPGFGELWVRRDVETAPGYTATAVVRRRDTEEFARS
ncbi:4'-phosphopantetheinyl transferase family protein [Streptomyces sp. NPDC059258]|uniref:4'-phosphopantetheinyl transferase family protein n=1 Tax=unclassified Streptomyces TaxID=2593676 RepID=UPI0036917FEC